MSTASVSGNAAPGTTQTQAGKASSSSPKAAGGASASQAPRGDLFAMLLMLAGNGMDGTADMPTSDAATEPGEEMPLEAAVGTDAGAWTAIDTSAGAADPVQAMLQSRYPLAPTAAGQPALESAASPQGVGQDSRGKALAPDQQLAGNEQEKAATLSPSDLAASDDKTTGAQAQPATPQAARPAALNPLRNDSSTHLSVRGTAGMASTAQLQAAGVARSMQEAAQAAVTYASRGADTPTWHSGLLARSTVTLDGRIAAADLGISVTAGSESDTPGLIAGTAPQAGGGQTGNGHGAALPDAGLAEAPGMQDELNTEDLFTDNAALAAEEEAQTYPAGDLQQARLSIAGDDGQTIDVQLKLAGQMVDVDFRTDDEQARESLSRQAGQDLADRLAQEGLSLADVSVGGRHGAQAGQGGDSSPARNTRIERRTAADAADRLNGTDGPSPAGWRPRTDGNRPLDMFV